MLSESRYSPLVRGAPCGSSSLKAVSSAWISARSFGGGIGFEPRQQLLFLYYQLRKSGHLFTVDYQRKGRSESGPCLTHQLRVPKLNPMLGPPP